ncbi:hypothetical protein Q6A90_00930 [Aliarcobacter skirrowii]|uniref:hypothetical protein n=1 Tax=Aliarcobacter skirrowii TaxID=28200 RepID=UPI0029BB8DD9|nr:hypothetical protein [Aliarcobacter skirrowii]MDX4060920.1 hypothetical protein [Aliarcobacter skirrowii]
MIEYKHKCSICNKEFENKYFDTKQYRCILHSDKENWDICNDKLLNDFEEIFLEKYHDEVNKDISIISNIHFPRNIFSRLINKISSNTITFNNSVFYGNIELENNKCIKSKIIFFSNCRTDNFIFKQIDVTKLGIFSCNFKNLKVEYSKINDFILENINKEKKENIYIKGSEFNLVQIQGFFINNFNISNNQSNKTFFQNIEIDNLNFNENTFLDRLDFIDVVIKNKIDLQDSFIPTNSSFFGLKSSKGLVDVANRETARKIKDSFEKQNNIIEANKFYALEMKEREKELEEDLKEGKNFFEWLVFKIHGISSNHSQDWTLALFWIISFTFTFLTIEFVNTYYLTHTIDYILIDILIFLGFVYGNYLIIEYKKINKFYYIGIYYIFYGFFSKDWLLKCFSNKLNPFSIMTGNEELTFSGLIYKIIIAYLIYQFIVSIRQNTRRK